MIKKRIVFCMTVAIMAMVVFTNCKDSDPVMVGEIDPQTSMEKTQLSTVGLIEDFRMNVNRNVTTRSGNLEKLAIGRIEDETIVVDLPSDIVRTRSGDSKIAEGKTSVKLETVFFESEGQDGFAIACSDSRINRVYAFTENGSLADTTFNEGLASVISGIPFIVKQDIENYYTQEQKETIETKADPYKVVTIGPLVQTAWNQGAPYNNNLAACTAGGHVLTGCVATAVAQVIAYYNYPATYSNWYNLPVLRTLNSIWTGHAQARNVAEFMRVVALGVKSNFGCESTGAKLYDAHVYFNSLGYYNLTRKNNANVNLTTLYRNMRRENIHLTSGFNKKPRAGHAWIWDGIYCVANSTDIGEFYALHCNWGWGGYCDGWYATFETPDPTPNNHDDDDNNHTTYLDDNIQLYIAMY